MNLSAGICLQFRCARKESRNVLAPHKANMKLPWRSDAIRLVNPFRFGNRNEFVQHSVAPKIASSSLMDQSRDWSYIKIRFDPLGVQGSGKTFAAQVRDDDVPMRIVDFVGVAIEQGVADKSCIQSDRERHSRL